MENSKMTSELFLEIVKSDSANEMLVVGNREGLKHLASAILDVASKDFDGAHSHFDEHTLDRCDIPLIIRLKLA
jgi:hypothetical protein